MTANIAIAFFFLFIIGIIVLDIAMIASLVRSGDERRQLMVWKASTFTLCGAVGVMVINVFRQIFSPGEISEPFSQLGATALIYFASLLYYRRKLGG